MEEPLKLEDIDKLVRKRVREEFNRFLRELREKKKKNRFKELNYL